MQEGQKFYWSWQKREKNKNLVLIKKDLVMAISMGRISNKNVRRFTRTLLSMQNMFYHQELKDEPLIVRDKLTKPLFRKQGELIRILLTHWILKFLSICIEFHLPIDPSYNSYCYRNCMIGHTIPITVVTRRRYVTN